MNSREIAQDYLSSGAFFLFEEIARFRRYKNRPSEDMPEIFGEIYDEMGDIRDSLYNTVTAGVLSCWTDEFDTAFSQIEEIVEFLDSDEFQRCDRLASIADFFDEDAGDQEEDEEDDDDDNDEI